MTSPALSLTYPAGPPDAPPADPSTAQRFMAALDARAMGPRLAEALRTGRRPCHVLDAKFEPGVQATVLYQHGDDLVRGDLLRAACPSTGAPQTRWPGLELSVYPEDPGLPALAMAVRPAVVGPQLAELAPALTPPVRRALVRRCRVELLRYRPGKRATLRLGTPVAAGGYVAKVYHDPAKAAAVADEAQALAQLAAADGALRLAPTIGHLPDLPVVVQRTVHGQPLDSLLQTPGPAAVEAVGRAATALAQLHQGAVVSVRSRPVGKELHRFLARSSRVATVDPLLGDRLTHLAERLLDTFPAFVDGSLGLVHGDCKPGQFLLTTGGGVYLLDFDHCGVSDPAGDAGTFVASLRQLGVQRTLAGAPPTYAVGLHTVAQAFIASYCRAIGADLSTRVRWYEVVALQRKALRSFARAPRSPLPAALVEEGHRCLDRVTQELR